METEDGSTLNTNLSSNSVNVSNVLAERNSTSTWDLKTIFEAASLSTLAVIGTAMSAFVFLLYHNKRNLRTSANTFVLSLTTSNFIRCVSLVPFYAIFIKNWYSGEILCKVSNSFYLFINLASVLCILLIALDRNCAVSDPLQYIKNNSKKRAGALIISIYIISVLLALPVLFGVPEFDKETCDIKISSMHSIFTPAIIYEFTIAIIAFIIPFISVAYLYHTMYRAAQNTLARDEMNSCSSCRLSDVIVNVKSPRSSGESGYSLRRHFHVRENVNSQRKRRFLKKHRAAVTGLLVVISFVICWSPYFIVRFYQQFRVVTIEVKFWVQFSTLMSSIFDPFVYFYRNRSTWSHTKKLIARIFNRKKMSMPLPIKAKNRIANISNHYRLSPSISKTIMEILSKKETNLHQNFEMKEGGKVEVTLHATETLQNNSNSYSMVAAKQFVHQDSSSSNCSSDACATIVSSDSGEMMNYRSLQKKYFEESIENLN